jgi:hypothetical protein
MLRLNWGPYGNRFSGEGVGFARRVPSPRRLYLLVRLMSRRARMLRRAAFGYLYGLVR